MAIWYATVYGGKMTCPSCEVSFEAPDDSVGKTLKCPTCSDDVCNAPRKLDQRLVGLMELAFCSGHRTEQVGFIALMPSRCREEGASCPSSALAPESALGSVPTVALSSAQADFAGLPCAEPPEPAKS
jgi:hypothetical protein